MTEETIGTTEQSTPRGPGRPRREATPVGTPTKLTEAPAGKKPRKRVGDAQRQILPDTSRLDQNYVYYVATDIKNNVNTLLDRGYEIVQSDESLVTEEAGKASSLGLRAEITANSTTGDKGVLMRIHKDLYAEDQADKQRVVRKSEEALISKDLKGAYTPGGKEGHVTRIGQ